MNPGKIIFSSYLLATDYLADDFGKQMNLRKTNLSLESVLLT
jgi:hypothetical protein